MNKNILQKEKPQKRLYSIKEASVYIGRSVWALREMLWAGKMPYVKDGRRILLDINDKSEDYKKTVEESVTYFENSRERFSIFEIRRFKRHSAWADDYRDRER